MNRAKIQNPTNLASLKFNGKQVEDSSRAAKQCFCSINSIDTYAIPSSWVVQNRSQSQYSIHYIRTSTTS